METPEWAADDDLGAGRRRDWAAAAAARGAPWKEGEESLGLEEREEAMAAAIGERSRAAAAVVGGRGGGPGLGRGFSFSRVGERMRAKGGGEGGGVYKEGGAARKISETEGPGGDTWREEEDRN